MKILFAVLLIVVIGIIFFAEFFSYATFVTIKKSPQRSIILSHMLISSPAFENNSTIPALYTCDGENINPPLVFSVVPQNAKSLVLIVDDPDAPGGTWDHWIVFNIPPTVKEIQEHSVPQGIESVTSWGKPGYGGPCPPSGTHHYHFTVYALSTLLSLDASAKKLDVEEAIRGFIIEQSKLIGLYKRQ